MIHIYTGNGKGKTTSAFGLAMRTSGHNHKVIIFQFLKPKALFSGEEQSVKRIKSIKLVKFNQMHPIFGTSYKSSKKVVCKLKEVIKKDFKTVESVVLSRRYDMVVLDEIINVVDQRFISKRSFIQFLKSVPQDLELVITGRGDISEIEQYADYVTIMVDKKHPFQKKKTARRGIEY